MEKKITITEEVANHELNAHLNLQAGDEEPVEEGADTCGGIEKPSSQGKVGYYQCVAGQWVWFPL